VHWAGSTYRSETASQRAATRYKLPPTPANVDFLKGWLRLLAQTHDGEGAAVLPVREEADLELAIRGTLALDVSERRLSRLIEFLDPTTSDGVYARLSTWCHLTAGEYCVGI